MSITRKELIKELVSFRNYHFGAYKNTVQHDVLSMTIWLLNTTKEE